MVNISTLGRSLEQIERIQQQQVQFQNLSVQLATGKKTQKFSGLGADDIKSLRTRASLIQLETYKTNITNADQRLQEMINNIEEFKGQTENFAGILVDFSKQSLHQKGTEVSDGADDPSIVGMTSSEMDTEFNSLQSFANKFFNLMGDLLNERVDDRYIMTGAESTTKPFSDNGLLDTSISTLLSGWKSESITSTELIADLQDRTATDGNANALTDTIVGYSSALSSGNVKGSYVRADDAIDLEYSSLANDEGFRNVMVAAAFFKSSDLPPIADTYSTSEYPAAPDAKGAPGDTTADMMDNFYQVFNELQKMVVESIDSMDQQIANLEQVRAQIHGISKAHNDEIALLQDTLGAVEDIDQSEVAVKINSLQVSLQASFSVTSLTSDLSLVNFL